jgi:hypothetical protein
MRKAKRRGGGISSCSFELFPFISTGEKLPPKPQQGRKFFAILRRLFQKFADDARNTEDNESRPAGWLDPNTIRSDYWSQQFR